MKSTAQKIKHLFELWETVPSVKRDAHFECWRKWYDTAVNLFGHDSVEFSGPDSSEGGMIVCGVYFFPYKDVDTNPKQE